MREAGVIICSRLTDFEVEEGHAENRRQERPREEDGTEKRKRLHGCAISFAGVR